ncbi:hypothetical protein AGOR_G00011530 [Albula goreensis]|uniref:Ig-like domain-containing protein n=1 Tax=Albula goreensis TaxID=1534307 RepID=A0A8T3EC08_9TELE|nr:hypothetical protein AGOR_G00011530 [Albula goreensis]
MNSQQSALVCRMLKNKDERKISLYCRTLSAVLCATAAYLNAGGAMAMEVTSTGPQTIQKAKGESVTLGCTYTAGPTDIGELDIEWSLVSPDMTQKDSLILSFTGRSKWIHGDPSLMKSLDFKEADPSMGDASIFISAVEVFHTGTFQCKVKRAPGVDMRKITLLVMERPSVPKCWAEGSESIGGTVSLHCKSSQGSAPLKYLWTKEGRPVTHASVTQNADTGELFISNHSAALAGTYRCEVSNLVGREQCRYTLRADRPPSRAGVIAGTVVGVLLLLIILLLLICLLICRFGKRCKNKEMANEIREDSPPPASRSQSRNTALYPGISYNSVRSPLPMVDSEFSSVYTDTTKPLKPPSSISAGVSGLKYDSRYGHPV